MSKALVLLREVTADLEFADKVRTALNGVRMIRETDEETIARMIKLARKVICPACHGYGSTLSNQLCGGCKGTGERPAHCETSQGCVKGCP